MDGLSEFLHKVAPGKVTEISRLEQLLAVCWDDLDGSSDGGMTGCGAAPQDLAGSLVYRADQGSRGVFFNEAAYLLDGTLLVPKSIG